MVRRQDIQGLRAVAVLAVIFYHFGFRHVPGGFLGVDIFFVISGYLITGIILDGLREGGFSFLDFCSRRLRRLAPAAIAMAGATLIAGAFIFYPQDLARQAVATIWALLGASNILFWLESGYFDADAILKPLLHTWSLAVEVQFYLLWPFLLMGLARARSGVMPVLGIAAVCVLGILLSVAATRIDTTAAFYLTPFRVHEFAIGGLAWCLRDRKLAGSRLADALYLLCLAIVIASTMLVRDTMPYLDLVTVPAVVATALLIWIGDRSRLAKLVGSWPLAAVGEVSYSAYLVHWPVVVFAAYEIGAPLSRRETLMLLGLVALLTLLLYRFVEQPFRRRPRAGRKQPFGFATGCTIAALLVCLPAAHVWATGGWRWRMGDALARINSFDQKTMERYIWPRDIALNEKADFVSDQKHVLVIGDSQAADIINVLAEGGVTNRVEVIARTVLTECGIPYLDERDRNRFLTTVNPPSMKDPTWVKRCSDMMDRAVTGPAWQKADVIIIAFVWRDFTFPYMARQFASLKARTSAPLYVVGGKMLTAGSIGLANRNHGLVGLGQFARKQIHPWTIEANALLRSLPDARFVDILSSFCDDRRCQVETDGRPVLLDPTHFTQWGARLAWSNAGQRLFSFLLQGAR